MIPFNKTYPRFEKLLHTFPTSRKHGVGRTARFIVLLAAERRWPYPVRRGETRKSYPCRAMEVGGLRVRNHPRGFTGACA